MFLESMGNGFEWMAIIKQDNCNKRAREKYTYISVYTYMYVHVSVCVHKKRLVKISFNGNSTR